MLEKFLPAIPAQLLSADGGKYGQVQIPSTSGFKVKQRVYIFSNLSIVKTKYEIKEVVDSANMIVGPLSPGMEDTADLTQYLVAANATIYADAQDRQSIPDTKWIRAVFEESPTVAVRTFGVDEFGNKYTKSNPFPVQLSDGSINIETLNAELRVQLSAIDNDPTAGDVHSSIRIGDGTREATINPDSGLNVHVVNNGTGSTATTRNTYAEVSIVPSLQTNVVSYTVPSGKTAILEKVTASSQDQGRFDLLINSQVVDTQRSYFGNFNLTFDFNSNGAGVMLVAGDTVLLKAGHSNADPTLFSGRVQVTESSV